MALQKAIFIDNNSGISAEYWKIKKIYSEWIADGSINTNIFSNTITIILEGYLSQQARIDGRDPFMSRTVVTNETDASSYFDPSVLQNSNLITQAYEYVKDNIVAFDGAIDI
jgi:hypothetical protein